MSERLSEMFDRYWQIGLTSSRANCYRQEHDQILEILRAHEDGWFDKPDALRARVAQLEAALKPFACDCKVNCPEPECDNWKARAALKDAPQ